MAGENEIVSSYRIDLNNLRGDVTGLVDLLAKVDKAGVDSAKNVSDAYTKQSKVIDGIKDQIAKLTELQKKAASPADVEKINKVLSEQNALLAKAEAAQKKVNAEHTKQVGILENIHSRIDKLSQAREKADNPQRIARFNQLISDQQKRVEQLTGSVQKAEKPTNAVGSAFESLGEKIIAAVAIERIIAFGEASIDEFAKTEKQTEKLRFSVEKLSGQESGALPALVKQSKELSEATFFSQSHTQQSQAMLTQFGLTREQVEKLIPGIGDLSVALDTDLTSATATVISALTGTTRGLKQINGDFKDTGNIIGNYNKVLEVLPHVQGAAADALNTTSGQFEKQKVEAEELEAQIGKGLAPALLNLKRVALEVAADFVELFFPESAKEKFRKNVDALRGIIEADNTSTVASLTQELTDIEKKIKEKNIAYKALNAEINKSVFVSPAKSDRLVALKKEYDNLIVQQKALQDAIEARKLTEQNAQTDAIKNAKREKLLHDDLLSLNTKELQARIDALKKRDDANNSFVQSAIQLTEAQLIKTKQAEEKAANDALSKRKSAIEQLKQIEFKFNADRLQQFAKSELDSLEIARNTEIARAKIEFGKAGGTFDNKGKPVGDLEAVTLFKKSEAQINALYDEKIADARIKKQIEVQQELRKINFQNLADDLSATLNSIDEAANAEIEREKKAFVDRAVFTEQGERELQARVDAIQIDAQKKKIDEQQRAITNLSNLQIQQVRNDSTRLKAIEQAAFLDRGDFSEAALQRLNDRLAEIDADEARTEIKITQDAEKEKEKAEADLTKVKASEADKQIEKQKRTAEEEIALRQRVFQASTELLSALAQGQSDIIGGHIQNLEFEKQQQDEANDQEQERLKENLDNRLITQKQYENQSADLKKKRVDSEKKIDAQINEQKRKQDLINRLRSLFEIGVNTAVGITKTIAEVGFPAAIPLVALVGALGIAQAAAVLATPLPKYAQGTKYLKRKNGEPVGTDTITIMADEGERIIPRKQNIRHWKVFESLDNGTFDEYVNQHYILPALVHAQKKSSKQRDNAFSENMVRSMMAMASSKDDDGNMFYDFTRMWNKGIRISNLNELAGTDRVKSIYTK